MTMTRRFWIIGVEHGANGPHDHLLLVVSGDEDGDTRGGTADVSGYLALAEAIDEGKESDENEARAHEHVAYEEDTIRRSGRRRRRRGTQRNRRAPASADWARAAA